MKSWIQSSLRIKRWHPSLIKQKKKQDALKYQDEKKELYLIGDLVYGSSRVTGAM